MTEKTVGELRSCLFSIEEMLKKIESRTDTEEERKLVIFGALDVICKSLLEIGSPQKQNAGPLPASKTVRTNLP